MSTARQYRPEEIAPNKPVFAFKEVDEEGEATLEVMSLAPRFNRWMFETIRPYLSGPVLEIGSGIGNLSEQLLATGMPAALSDIRGRYCDSLRQRFVKHSGLMGIHQLDLVHPEFERVYRPLLSTFNSVFALNVVEHIEDDHRALTNAKLLLRPGGQLIILVPAYQMFYNRIDRELGHYRRYTRSSLNQRFRDTGLDIQRSFYFNMAGLPGWFVSGGLLRSSSPHAGLVKLYNSLVGVFRLLDRVTFNSIGLSVITIGRKPEAVSLPVAA